MSDITVIKPQEGYQMMALSSEADIVIGGGAAGVGKTFCLLLEPLRHINTKNFGAVIFRRTSPMIRSEGGLWDASSRLYRNIKTASSRESPLEWIFPGEVKIKFSHMEHEKNVYDWQGSEIPLICFDELTHFSRKMFFYMLSRNRSICGVKPYVRATCNPDPDSWVSDFISWWIDQDKDSPGFGLPIPDRQGKVRYLVLENDNYVWGDSIDEVYDKTKSTIDLLTIKSGIKKENFIKSVTFIGGSIFDNKKLLKVNPEYLGNLNSQPEEVRKRLLDGNWSMSVDENDIYDHSAFMDIFTNTHVLEGEKFITTDIAMKGSNKFVVKVWSGKRLIDVEIVDKTLGNEVIDVINKLSFIYKVPNRNIAFDNDGVGQYVDGFIIGAQEFNNGARALDDENYANLKTQCYYKSGDAINRNEYYITERVQNKRYDDKMTVKERMIYERKAIKRDSTGSDGKLKIIKKETMKNYLNGESPDLMDAFMMREFFEFKENKKAPIMSFVSG